MQMARAMSSHSPTTKTRLKGKGKCTVLRLSWYWTCVYPSTVYCLRRLKIIGQVLRDIRQRDLSVTVHGDRVKSPIGVSPCAMHKLANEDGECATARGEWSYCNYIVRGDVCRMCAREHYYHLSMLEVAVTFFVGKPLRDTDGEWYLNKNITSKLKVFKHTSQLKCMCIVKCFIGKFIII